MKNNFYRFSPLYIVFIIVSTLLFHACVKDKIDLNKSGNNSINPQYAAALIYSSLSLADIMAKTNKNGQLTTDSTGFITLVYKGNLFSLKAADLVTIPSQNPVSATYALSATDVVAVNAAPVGGTITVKDSSLINFQTGGAAQINILNCKTATLSLNLNYDIEQNALIKVSIPGATLGGVIFTQNIPVTVPVPYSGGPIAISKTYSLDGYTIDMTNGGTTQDVIKVLYSIVLTKTTNTESIGDGITFTETFSNVTYNSIIGYLGQQSLSPNTDTIPITIFKNNILGAGATFKLVNPSIKVFLTNSYGLPINAHFNLFEGYTPGQSAIAITGAPNPLPIPVPATIGQSVKDSFTLNNSNSNLTSLINNFPKNVIYNVSSQSNPGGTVYTNFITDTSQFNVDMEVDLPLYGTVTNFMFQDTVAYGFNLQTNNVEAITVRAYISNGFPIDVGMRIAFVDSAYNVIDELISPPNKVVIPSASVGSNGMVTASTQSSADFSIPSSVIPQLNKVKYILLGAVANTVNNGGSNVKIYDFYRLDIKLGVNVQLLLKF